MFTTVVRVIPRSSRAEASGRSPHIPGAEGGVNELGPADGCVGSAPRHTTTKATIPTTRASAQTTARPTRTKGSRDRRCSDFTATVCLSPARSAELIEGLESLVDLQPPLPALD